MFDADTTEKKPARELMTPASRFSGLTVVNHVHENIMARRQAAKTIERGTYTVQCAGALASRADPTAATAKIYCRSLTGLPRPLPCHSNPIMRQTFSTVKGGVIGPRPTVASSHKDSAVGWMRRVLPITHSPANPTGFRAGRASLDPPEPATVLGLVKDAARRAKGRGRLRRSLTTPPRGGRPAPGRAGETGPSIVRRNTNRRMETRSVFHQPNSTHQPPSHPPRAHPASQSGPNKPPR